MGAKCHFLSYLGRWRAVMDAVLWSEMDTGVRKPVDGSLGLLCDHIDQNRSNTPNRHLPPTTRLHSLVVYPRGCRLRDAGFLWTPPWEGRGGKDSFCYPAGFLNWKRLVGVDVRFGHFPRFIWTPPPLTVLPEKGEKGGDLTRLELSRSLEGRCGRWFVVGDGYRCEEASPLVAGPSLRSNV